jgi:signal transduction histidine kinase
MKELSLNILDICENSTKAGATLVEITITESTDNLEIVIKDDGVGMTREVLQSVTNPFYTTRTTRRVGMGIPLFKLSAEQTGGHLKIESRHIDEFPDSHGTQVLARFIKTHMDFTPLGDIVSTVKTLIQGHPDIDFVFTHSKDEKRIYLDTREIRAVLESVPLDSFEVLCWIGENLSEQYNGI